VLQSEAANVVCSTHSPLLFEQVSRVTIELVPEIEATRVSVTHDQWVEGDAAYASSADGWPRILSRLKTLIRNRQNV